MAQSHVRVAVVGATGYTSLEAVRWLLRHPQAEVTMVCSRRDPQPRFDSLFGEFRGRFEKQCEPIDPETIARRADVAVLCLPHKVAMGFAKRLLALGMRVIDLSADYRLKDPDDYREWYQHEHEDLENLEQAVYGLPELFRAQIPDARLVANPGCYPTGAILGIAPLLNANLLDVSEIIVDSASGISGAGNTPKPEHHFPERHETFEAYGVGTHRHMIEIQRTLDILARGLEPQVIFTPHLVPMERGILSTIYLKPLQPLSDEHVAEVYAKAYENEPFVRFQETLPSTKNVARTNFCDVTVRVVKSRVVAITAIDNMVKGAAGQAIQNMNLMFGLSETCGLL